MGRKRRQNRELLFQGLPQEEAGVPPALNWENERRKRKERALRINWTSKKAGFKRH